MSIQSLTADFAVAGQISPEDLPAIAAAGFKSVICNRPDGEAGPSQPAYSAIEQAAVAAGLQVRYLKVVDKSGYQALPWVRYITEAGEYEVRMPGVGGGGGGGARVTGGA